jgi:hypothetical protein
MRIGTPNPQPYRRLILNLISNVQVQRLGLIQQIHETQRIEMSLDPNEKRKHSAASLVIVPNPKLPCYLFIPKGCHLQMMMMMMYSMMLTRQLAIRDSLPCVPTFHFLQVDDDTERH